MGSAGRQKTRRAEKTSAPAAGNPPLKDFLSRPLIPLSISLILALLVNLNVLQNGLGWDDETIISNLRPPENWLQFLRPVLPDGSSIVLSKENSSYFRPIVSISYQLDHFIWGRNPVGFHLSVLLAHLINTVFVFFLARELMLQTARSPLPGPNPASLNRFIPFLAAALFAVHPAHAEAVAWIPGRNDVFCTAFMLASLLLYIRFRRTRDWAAFGFAMPAFFLALLTKETAVGLVILFPLYDYLSMTADAPPALAPLLPRRAGALLLIPTTILALYFWMRIEKIMFPSGQGLSVGLLGPDTIRKVLGAVGLYLKLLIFPYPHRPFIQNLPDSTFFIILSALITALLFGGLVLALIRRSILFGIGLAWMFALLAPAVSVAVLNVAATPAAERYVYAPSVGFLIAAAGLIAWGIERLTAARRSPSMTVSAAVLLLLSIMTVWGLTSRNRNSVWRDSVTFWQAGLVAAPDAGFPRRELGKHLVELGRLEEAEPLYRQAVLLDEKAFGLEHPGVGASLNLLGTLLQKEGRYAEAEPAYQRALKIREKTLGPEHMDTAASLNNLAEIYYRQRKYAEAEPLYQRAIAVYEKAVGPNHSDTAQSLNNLAGLYDAQGKYAEAEPLYQRALAIREKSLGPDHTDVAQTLNNLAVLYHRQGRYAEAESLYKRSLNIREKILGPNHADLAAGLNNLAGLYIAQGKYAEAEPLFQRALVIREKTLRPDHPDLVTSLENYAVLLRKMKRDAEAALMETRARMIRSRQGTAPSPK